MPLASIRNCYQFFRPTLIGLAGLLVAVVTCESLSVYLDRDSAPLENEVANLTKPSPDLAPEQVVRIQVDALANSDDPLSVLQCMVFASPQNRIVTGPVARFGLMMRASPFNVFRDARSVLVGRAEFPEGRARVLVTVVDGKSRPHAFVWVLAPQTVPPFSDCWMTEGVMHVPVPATNQADDDAVDSKVI